VLKREALVQNVRRALRRSRVVALIGPRQSGKTTLARQFVEPGSSRYFDLENPNDRERLAEPLTALGGLRGLVVLDEIQRIPELFPILRVLADRTPLVARFLVLGSAGPALLRQASESLAGRLETVPVSGFSASEVGASGAKADRHWLRGGLPLSFLARSNADSVAWRRSFLAAFVERDLPALGGVFAPEALRRFWGMLAHVHGGIWHAADPARSLGIGESTARRYLDLFTSALIVRQLQPWHENLGKRQVKAPKVYVRDSGLLHTLLGISTRDELLQSPRSGASWEGYVIEEVLNALAPDEAYFWATHGGAELDLMLFLGGRRYGIEVKRADAPRMTPSMRSAMADLSLARLSVLYPGDQRYVLADRVAAVPASVLLTSARARAELIDARP
jgi:predicted AAA+ superfamily ATPase